ncbi:hypothetical protein ACFXCU_25500, partial [Streptomyces virginiae]
MSTLPTAPAATTADTSLRTVLITGTSSGIGLAAAVAAARPEAGALGTPPDHTISQSPAGPAPTPAGA